MKLWISRVLFVLEGCIVPAFMIALTSALIEEFVTKQENRFMFKNAILRNENVSTLYFTAFSFYGFIATIFFRKSLMTSCWWLKLAVLASMAWLSTPMLFLTLISSKSWEWLFAGIVTMTLMFVHSILMLLKKSVYEFQRENLAQWSIRLFLCSSIGICISIAWQSSHIDICVAYFLLVGYLAVLIICGRTIGSIKFYVKEIKSCEFYYLIMINYNFVMIYSLILLALCKTRCILSNKPRHQHMHAP